MSYIQEYENKMKIDTKEKLFDYMDGKKFNEENVLCFCKEIYLKDTTNEYTIMKKMRFLNEIIEPYNIKITLNKLYDIGMKFKKTKDGLISREELDKYVSILENPQDQAILYCLFFGIAGKELKELRELRVSDIDLEDEVINVSSRKIKMDKNFSKIIREAIEQDRYYPIRLSENAMVDEIPYNMNSEYLLKQRPTIRNNNGFNPISYRGLRERICSINNYLDTNNLKNDILVKSGYAYKIHNEISGDISYSIVSNFIKENDLKINTATLINTYKEIYGNNKN